MTATKQKMLAKLKQLKSSNDSLVGQVDELTRQLETQSSALAEVPRLESEVEKLTRCLSVLEEERKNWHRVEDEYKATVSSVREELLSVEMKREDEMRMKLAAADAEKHRLEEQIQSARDELRSKVVDYESQLTALSSQKNSIEASLDQTKNDFGGREEALKRKLADLQTLHEAVLSDTENYQQLLEQLRGDNSRLEQLLQTRSETVDKLHEEIKALNSDLAEANSQKEELEKKYDELVEQKEEFEKRYDEVVEQKTSYMASTEVELKNMEQVKCDLDSARNENTALLEEIDGLKWKMVDLSGLEQELSQLQTEMFDVQSENGMLKKRLSFLEKDALERSGAEENCSRQVEQLMEKREKLLVHVECLESEVNLLRAQLEARRPSTAEFEDVGVQCVEERSGNVEIEEQRARERVWMLDDEHARLGGTEERQSLKSRLEEMRDGADAWRQDEVTQNLQVELDQLRERFLMVESENTRLKSVVEGIKSNSEVVYQKMVACRTGSPTMKVSEAEHRQQRTEQTSLHSYRQTLVSKSACFI